MPTIQNQVKNGFNAGPYKASETQQYGYKAGSWGGDCAADGQVQIGVFEHHHRILATHLALYLLHLPRSLGINDAADFAGAREGDALNARMAHERRARLALAG